MEYQIIENKRIFTLLGHVFWIQVTARTGSTNLNRERKKRDEQIKVLSEPKRFEHIADQIR